MRNKIIKLLVISLFLLVLVGCNRSEYKYSENDGSITISEYTGSSEYLIVPDVYQEKAISTIDYNTYAYNINIRYVRLSSNIKTIKECAFWYCINLESIYIPKGLEKIEECAFYSCTNLKYIYYEASESEVNLTILASNECFRSAVANYNVTVEEYENIINEKK